MFSCFMKCFLIVLILIPLFFKCIFRFVTCVKCNNVPLFYSLYTSLRFLLLFRVLVINFSHLFFATATQNFMYHDTARKLHITWICEIFKMKANY